MKVIHNLIVTSLASAQKLHSRVRVLKNSTHECARETLALQKFHSRVRALDSDARVRTCIKSLP